MGCSMARAFSMFGLGAVFLWISPKLRGGVQEAIGGVYMGVQTYAPYSYIAGILLVLIALVVSVNRGSQSQ